MKWFFFFRNEASNGNKNNFNNLSNESDNQGLKGELKASISKKKKNKNQGKNSESNETEEKHPINSNLSETILTKEIECTEALIFGILNRSKAFYEKDWNVIVDILEDKETIKLSSRVFRSVERLNESIHTIIKNLVKITIEYKDTEYENVTRILNAFKNKYKKNLKIRIIYLHLENEKMYQIGLTTYSDSEINTIELLKNEIIGWNFNIVVPIAPVLLVFNYKSNLEGLIKTHLSNIFNVSEEQLRFYTLEEVLILEYDPKISKFFNQSLIFSKLNYFFCNIAFDKILLKHNKLLTNTEQLKDLKLVKLVNTNKLIFDVFKLDSVDSVKTFLEVEHEIAEYNVEHAAYGLYVVTFNNKKDKGKLFYSEKICIY